MSDEPRRAPGPRVVARLRAVVAADPAGTRQGLLALLEMQSGATKS